MNASRGGIDARQPAVSRHSLETPTSITRYTLENMPSVHRSFCYCEGGISRRRKLGGRSGENKEARVAGMKVPLTPGLGAGLESRLGHEEDVVEMCSDEDEDSKIEELVEERKGCTAEAR